MVIYDESLQKSEMDAPCMIPTAIFWYLNYFLIAWSELRQICGIILLWLEIWECVFFC